MAKKGKARVRNEATSTLQDDQISNQIEEENVETNPNHSEAPSSNPSTNEVYHPIGEQNVRGKAKGVKSGEGIEVEIYDGRLKRPDQMENIRSTATSEGSLINEWEIYRNVTGEPSHGRVLGLGTGVKGKDVYGSSSSQTCSKKCEENQKRKEEEWEGRFKKMESIINELQQQVPVMVQTILQSLGVPSAPIATQGGANGLRDLSINSHDNITKESGNINVNDNNDNSFVEDCERGDDPRDDDGDNDEDENGGEDEDSTSLEMELQLWNGGEREVGLLRRLPFARPTLLDL
ncbi:GATA zinc finger domain-containing protein 13-like [Dioscorea cayenensis subsp. rotundata]|uniref:GATA zinc finger domain-containing protein 13-like n=1 Tax=Dioscorea cayennensis subsp. rotundata TaxID=55577 RepID=A0AB40AZZ8_DIOCR|nr:GATA zinc finger domain-containing protein 13-like [Dioscorea cayenensis subsp. rotundata]